MGDYNERMAEEIAEANQWACCHWPIAAIEQKHRITALRSILSRVREWVDGAALVETEEREIRGILEEEGEG